MRAHVEADLQRTATSGNVTTNRITIHHMTAHVKVEGRGDRMMMVPLTLGADGLGDATTTTILKANDAMWVARDVAATMTNAADANTRGEVKKEKRGSDTKRRNAVIETSHPRINHDGKTSKAAATIANGDFAIINGKRRLHDEVLAKLRRSHSR
ncbi:hypothetical protein MHU86_1823 [Fragilaria crotonensis]|nr:hypothetical protein MHU86_1823 [Fragilaria crotonensis]